MSSAAPVQLRHPSCDLSGGTQAQIIGDSPVKPHHHISDHHVHRCNEEYAQDLDPPKMRVIDDGQYLVPPLGSTAADLVTEFGASKLAFAN